jgi:hypothetical protein
MIKYSILATPNMFKKSKQIFGCEVRSLPFKYLGIPIHYMKLYNKEWKPVDERFKKKLAY